MSTAACILEQDGGLVATAGAERLYFYRESRPPDLAKIAQSHKTDRGIPRRYGPGILGAAETWRLIGPWRSTRHLYHALSAEERRAAEEILEGIAERRAA